MTLDELNILLARLNSEKKRETVFEFAFSLIQWMGIEPVQDKKPKLLSPQTKKLMDILIPAPLTVQPQLYRMSSETHNIRVRLAVLKKIKKDNINLLVINDPGLTSYQAITKGIDLKKNGSAFNPSQPYYLHFATTSEYDKLIVIFNQGDQKRILTFRDKLTHTQYYRLLEQWKDIGHLSKPEISNLFWSSLDIKEVNKEFYRKVKERFDALIGIINDQKPGLYDQAVKQFTVRLIGRYIFCWFLKEKEIIPTRLLSSSTIQDFKNSFSGVILKKLFFMTLNAEVTDTRRDEIKTELDEYFKTIPYLNGGLFEWQSNDELLEEIEMKDWLIEFVKVLEEYDFTVDESSSNYQQIAIDPEMLGRIFENLLASQNEETEKLANQRKAFGAFYTPREIVDYMVNESLKAHLGTYLLPDDEYDITEVREKAEPAGSMFENLVTTDSPKKDIAAEFDRKKNIERINEKIEKLFAPENSENPFDREETKKVRGALTNVKILDPACGSGAFPMGMLLRLMEIRQIVGHPHKNNYELKNEILSKNIYGVDVMPMAVEIARLRAWLSLILEADYKPADRKNNFGIAALPNLDFKFVCANSLIDSGYDEFTSKLEEGYSKNNLVKSLNEYIKRLQEIRNEYFDPQGNKDKKKQLQDEFFKIKSNIKNDFTSIRKTWNLGNFLDRIDDWNPFDDSKPSSFFSPGWMFGISDGFDIVIGNPPYVQLQKDAGKLNAMYEKQSFETFERTGDIYSLFYEKGIQLLKNKGHLTFITSNKWMRAGYGKRTRAYLAKQNPLKLIDLGSGVFESATVDTNILVIQKTRNLQVCLATDLSKSKKLDNFHNLSYQKMSNFGAESWTITSHIEKSIKEKIERIGKPLKEWDINIYRGVLTGFNEAFIIDGKKKDELIALDSNSAEIIKPILRGRDIKRYKAEFADLWLINTHNGVKEKNIPRIDVVKDYPAIYKHLLQYEIQLQKRQDQGDHWTNLRNCAYLLEFEQEKIVYNDICQALTFSKVPKGFYFNNTAYFINTNSSLLLSILNSRLANWYYRTISVQLGDKAVRMFTIYVEQIPIPELTEKTQQPFVLLIDQILTRKEQGKDTTALEKEIDIMVYKLYDLSYEEVKIVDPEFELTEKDRTNLECKF